MRALSGSRPEDVHAIPLATIAALVRERTGVDLDGYRRATLLRRIQNRMISAGVATLSEYVDLLRADGAEAERLLERVTIKVSRFFRNGGAVAALARALRRELDRAPRRLSAWSAGCGNGEEPYTIAMLLAELGQARGGSPQVLATDVDAAALAGARSARYGDASLVEVPERLRGRYLRRESGAHPTPWTVEPRIRGAVELARHDIARAGGAPGGRHFDLVSCRNTLIYFERDLQERALRTLCAALVPGGLLWLGEAEWPGTEAAMRLETLDRAARLFRLRPGKEADA